MLGGSAAHFAMSCRLFTDVHLVAIIGSDFPERYINFLHQKGIVLTSLIRSSGKTFKWKGEYRQDLNTAITLSTELGVILTFRPKVAEEQRNIKNIFLANIDPDIQNHLLSHMRLPKLVALDSMNYWITHKRKALLKLLKKVNIYVANDQEARALSGENNLIKAAKHLSSFGPEMILVKKGEHGLIFFSDRFKFCLPAYPIEKVVDPTGAGDTFAGGFMGCLARARRIDEKTIKKALTYGTVCASFNIEEFGLDRTSRLTRQDLDERLARFRKLVLF
jgi:sugar/nucleoside kinase (ribokinase family)